MSAKDRGDKLASEAAERASRVDASAPASVAQQAAELPEWTQLEAEAAGRLRTLERQLAYERERRYRTEAKLERRLAALASLYAAARRISEAVDFDEMV